MFARQEKEEEQTAEQIEEMQVQNQQQLEEINNIRFELEELKAKYLPKHIAIMAEHEDIRPAMVIASSKSCVAYNKYGEPLLITDSLCYQMNEFPAYIPRTRQVREQLNTDDSFTDNPFSSPAQADTNIEYFDSRNEFVTGS
jgi:hypothetical protein